MRQPTVMFIIALLATFGLGSYSCTAPPNFDTVYRPVTESRLQPGEPIPLPKGKPILTVEGKIGAANQDDTITLDLSTIESIGVVEYTTTDLFEKQLQTFQGVLMKDLLDLWQVEAAATTLTIVALNDYKVDVPIEMLRQYPVILALKQAGEYMQEDYRGPAMLIFPTDDYRFNETQVASYSVWQIKSITVK